jgi:hypothetical protein
VSGSFVCQRDNCLSQIPLSTERFIASIFTCRKEVIEISRHMNECVGLKGKKHTFGQKKKKKCSTSLAIKETLRSHLTSQNGYDQEHKQQMLVRMWGKRNLHTLLVGM